MCFIQHIKLNKGAEWVRFNTHTGFWLCKLFKCCHCVWLVKGYPPFGFHSLESCLLLHMENPQSLYETFYYLIISFPVNISRFFFLTLLFGPPFSPQLLTLTMGVSVKRIIEVMPLTLKCIASPWLSASLDVSSLSSSHRNFTPLAACFPDVFLSCYWIILFQGMSLSKCFPSKAPFLLLIAGFIPANTRFFYGVTSL